MSAGGLPAPEERGEADGAIDRNTELRGEGVGLRLQALAAAAKEKQPETHDAQHPSRGTPCLAVAYQYAGPEGRYGLNATNHTFMGILDAGSDSRITQCHRLCMDLNDAQPDPATCHTPVFCTIIPPHILDNLAQSDDPERHEPARRTLEHDHVRRTERRAIAARGGLTPASPAPPTTSRTAPSTTPATRRICPARRSAAKPTAPPRTPPSTAPTPVWAPPSSSISRSTAASPSTAPVCRSMRPSTTAGGTTTPSGTASGWSSATVTTTCSRTSPSPST